MDIKGKQVIINKNPQQVYEFLADFNNIKGLMPEQVQDWESDKETCSFKISGIGKIKMKYLNKQPYSLIEMGPDGSGPLNFALKINLKEQDGKTVAEGNIYADLNPMLAMMAKRPLENLMNEITSKLQGKL